MNTINYNINLNSNTGEIIHLKLQLRDLLFQEMAINDLVIKELSNVTDRATLLSLSEFQNELIRVCYDSDVYNSLMTKIKEAVALQ